MELATNNSEFIKNFKANHADAFAWAYDFCRTEEQPSFAATEIRQNILKFAKVMDISESKKTSPQNQSLVEHIRQTKGFKLGDAEALNITNIFSSSDNLQQTTILARITKALSFDIGDIQELFENLIESLVAIKNYLGANYRNVAERVHLILKKLDIIIETLKRMKHNAPLMVHIQNKLEMSQVNLRVA